MIAQAQYGAAGDTYASALQPNAVQGGDLNMTVTGTSAGCNQIGGSSAISYVNFSAPFVPAGASISSAQLVVYVDYVYAAGSLDVYTLLTPWNEATLTYNTRPTLGPLVISGVPVSKAGFVSFDVTSAYLANLAGNGFAIVANQGTPGVAVTFDTKENVSTSHSPYLNVVLSSGLIPRGSWNPTVQYNPNDLVTYGGSAYVSNTRNMNQTPGVALGHQLRTAHVGHRPVGGVPTQHGRQKQRTTCVGRPPAVVQIHCLGHHRVGGRRATW